MDFHFIGLSEKQNWGNKTDPFVSLERGLDF